MIILILNEQIESQLELWNQIYEWSKLMDEGVSFFETSVWFYQLQLYCICMQNICFKGILTE